SVNAVLWEAVRKLAEYVGYDPVDLTTEVEAHLENKLRAAEERPETPRDHADPSDDSLGPEPPRDSEDKPAAVDKQPPERVFEYKKNMTLRVQTTTPPAKSTTRIRQHAQTYTS